MINKSFWNGKRVFITGHTGFKGSWMSIWLTSMGAEVYGYALQPATNPSLFIQAEIEKLVHHSINDIRDKKTLFHEIEKAKPDIVFHMEAQPLVRESYREPAYTYETNVMGTVNVFEAIRNTLSVRALINITTDKVYENNEWYWGYRENEPLGDYDPYSSSRLVLNW